MKRTVFAVIVLLSLGTTSLFAIQITSVDDVIRMHRTGVSDEVILASLERLREPIAVTRDDVIAMEDAGISAEVIDAVLAAARTDSEAPADRGESAEPVSTEAEDSPETSSEGECVTYDPPILILWPGYSIPEWLWDPHWYMPRYYSETGARAEQKTAAPPVAEREPSRPSPSREESRKPLRPRIEGIAPVAARQ